MRAKALLSLAGAFIAAVALVSASGAATTKAQKVTKINVSTRAAVVHYLRSIHVNPKGAVIQRGARNYAGARCPGGRWTCASTRHTVVQIAKQGGQNRFMCKSSKCVVVQVSGTEHGVYFARRLAATPTKPTNNSAVCVKTGSGANTGGGQVCTIDQSGNGTNTAGVYENTNKVSGITQTAQYAATITQRSSGSGAAGNNTACVTQMIALDGSTSNTNTKGVTVNLNGFQKITVTQNTFTGSNSAQNAALSTGACDMNSTAIAQSQTLSSTVNTKGSITQNQDILSSPTNCVPAGDTSVFSGCANLVTDIEQNQADGVKGIASGLNNANFTQSINEVEIANTPNGTVTQQQNADVPNPPYSGVVGTINQDSTAKSTAVVTQNETQCQDAVNVPTIAPTTVCPNNPDSGVPSGVTLKQTQYGPLGVGVLTPSKKSAGRVLFHLKGYGRSQQTNAGPAVVDQFTLTQNSSQKQDDPGPNVTLKQANIIKGDCASSGNGSPTGGACAFTQSATLNGVTNGTTSDGYTAGAIGGSSSNPPLVISCSNGHSTCQPTPPPAPVIDSTPKPAHVIEAGSGGTTFTWTDVAKNNSVTYECSTDNSTWHTCTSGDSHAQFANTAAGDYNFYVRAVDSSGNRSAADSWSWSVVDANISISPLTPVNEVGTAEQFTVTVTALPAGTGAPSFADPVITETPTPGTGGSTCDPNTKQVNGNVLTCTVTINSSAAGTFDVQASDKVTMGGVQVTRTTGDGVHSDSASAVKNYVDANIAISPLTPVNVVGTAETFTVTVTAFPAGTGTPSFADPVITETPTPDTGGNSCDANSIHISGNVLTCSVTINSNTPGSFTVKASDKVTMGGVDVTRTTGDSHTGDSASAVASYVLPTPVIDPNSEPADGTSSTSANFLFSDSDSSLSFVCSQDGNTYTACSPTAGPGSGEEDYTGLATGPQNFYVEGTDGTHYSAPASYSWTIVPPA